jgi:NAD(P)-dependent dehydrogenase (short-subunit alcohol dehydrogenase family)
MNIKGSKVVVVGGSSGIGQGVASAALEKGSEVVIVGRSQEKLEKARVALGKTAKLTTIAADVTREEEIAQMFADIGMFDHLVVTRGSPPIDAPIAAFDMDVVRSFVELVLVSAVTVAKHAVGKLRVGGSMTFTSGITKDKPGPGGSVTAAVAGSLGYLAHALALELAPTRVNVVSPGWVDTPMWDEFGLPSGGKTALWEEMASRLPAGRIATPADTALAYIYLMESELTTGTVLKIDGGHALI